MMALENNAWCEWLRNMCCVMHVSSFKPPRSDRIVVGKVSGFTHSPFQRGAGGLLLREPLRKANIYHVSRFTFHLSLYTVFLLLWLSSALWAISYDDDTQLDFIWKEATGNPHHYNVYVSVDEGEYVLVGTTETNSYTVMGENGHSYWMKVEAQDAFGNVGPMSEESDLVICQVRSSFTSHLSAGINMIAVPLNPKSWRLRVQEKGNTDSAQAEDVSWRLSDLASHIGSDLSVVIFYDTVAEKFIAYMPKFPATAPVNVPVTRGKGYIVIMQQPVDVTFEGAAWDGDVTLAEGINILSVPLRPESEWRLNNLIEHIGSEVRSVIWYDKKREQFVGYSLALPKSASTNAVVKGDEGYIVLMKAEKKVTFTGKTWENKAATALPKGGSRFYQNVKTTPILIVEGFVSQGLVKQENVGIALNGMQVRVRNLNNQQDANNTTGTVSGDGRYVVILMDFLRNAAAQTGDVLELTVFDPTGTYSVESIRHPLSASEIKAHIVSLNDIRMRMLPKQSALLQNYPNPFNPETWIPYQLSSASEVAIQIYDIAGHFVRTLFLGNQPAGYYQKKHRAAYWDGHNEYGEQIASGVYFYTLKAGTFRATRKFTLMK